MYFLDLNRYKDCFLYLIHILFQQNCIFYFTKFLGVLFNDFSCRDIDLDLIYMWPQWTVFSLTIDYLYLCVTA